MKRISNLLLIVILGLILIGCHKHNYDEVITEPTCTEVGYTLYKCSCGESYKDNYAEALGHTEEIIKGYDATCTTKGLTDGLKCKVCNTILKEQTEIQIKEHIESEWIIDVEPTCTEKGSKHKQCNECLETIKTEEIASLGHSYGEWKVVKEATETEKGLKEKVCSNCNDKLQEEIPLKEHQHQYKETIYNPTCTEVGYTLHTCSCGDSYKDSEVKALGHTEEIIKGYGATCLSKGLTDGLKCKVCNTILKEQTEIKAKGHSYGEWKVIKEATETEKGLKEKVCSNCNDKQQEEIPLLNHTHKYTDKVINPTCTEVGYTLHTCSCGDSYKDSEVKALGHTEEIIKGYDATCTTKGLTDGLKCKVCNTILKEQTEIKVKGHSYGEWKVIKEATETEKGLKQKQCSNCNELVTEEIPMIVLSENINKTINELTTYFSSIKEINSNLELATSKNNTTISYKSSNESVLTNDGVYIRPYKDTNITVTATISDGTFTKTKEFNLKAKGYKEQKNMAASYVYTNYSKLTNEFFETMDIIYCAFVLIDTDGNFTGKDGLGNSINSTNNTYLKNMKNYVIPKAHEKGDWVLVSVGGGGKAYDLAFESICESETKMDTLANNIVKLINDYGFDGVDIDWEIPDEGTKFTKLMKKIYKAVKDNNPNHLVTAAIGGGMWQPPKYDLNNSKNYLDYINLMTYNMTTSSGQHHTALYQSKTKFDKTNNVGYTLTSCSIDESVSFYNEKYGISPKQLIIGAAFYGIKQTRTSTSSDWKSSGTLSYDKIKSSYLNNSSYKYVFDTNCQAAYLLSNDRLTFISFDDQTSLKAKCQYVISQNCAGIMYWQNGQDTTGDLVKAIKEGLSK